MKLELVIYPDRDYLFHKTWVCKVLSNKDYFKIQPTGDCNYLKIFKR